LEIRPERLNSAEVVGFVKKTKPDATFIFGASLIKEPLLSTLPHNTLNLHLGISPRYRGAATLFWPFYFLEPPYAGSTFHYIVGEPDAGDIVHQAVPHLDIRDGIHDVACKTVIVSAHEALALIEILRDKGRWKTRKQRSTGKNFLASDFKPEHLRVIYNQFNDDIVKYYLEGKLKSKTPNLVRQF
jgi:methionyl-tRNA formyltransferase